MKKLFLIPICIISIILTTFLLFKQTYSLDNLDIKYEYTTPNNNYIKTSNNISIINNNIILVLASEIENFITSFDSNGAIEIYDKENNLLKSGKIKTGHILKLTFSNETLEYKISVIGDLNSDGIINHNDIIELSKYILSNNTLNEEFLYAADIDINHSININDVIKLVKYLNGNYNFEDNLNKENNTSNISFEKQYDEIYLNSENKTKELTLKNTTNQEIIWTSSDDNIASISSNGILTAKELGTVKITATTKDGNIQTSMNISIKKKIIIIIGASQVTKMKEHTKNYSSSNYNYTTNDETLIYIEKSGSGIEYQYNEGYTKALTYINSYEKEKEFVDFYLYFPLSGNTIKQFVCNDKTNNNSLGSISKDNKYINGYLEKYNEVHNEIKNMNYNIESYIVSMHPVKVSQATDSYVVTNENKNSCQYEYRSNWKYYLFNNVVEEIINENYSKDLIYISLFSNIMETNDLMQNFSYKITYNTIDGVHWDEETTNTYVNMMLNHSGKL